MTRAMKAGVAVLSIMVVFPSLAKAQGIGALSERLTRLEEKVKTLESLQKKNSTDTDKRLTEVENRAGDANTPAALPAVLGRLDSLEKSVQVLQTQTTQPVSEDDAQTKATLSGIVDELKGLIGEVRGAVGEKKPPAGEPVKSKTGVELYGYIKLDASYDSPRLDAGNYARWATADAKEVNQMAITARQTRFGVNYTGTEGGGIKPTAKLEFDFYGSGDTENKNALLMRHAYLKIAFKGDFSILAGQASDVISPLFPSTVNYVVGWWAGNIGYRRPQIRLTKGFALGKTSKWVLEAAAVRAIGGETEGEPAVQGRSSWTFPSWTDKKITLGVSGHFGKEELESESWSANVDLSLPLLKKVLLEGEWWMGKNCDAYLGGIGQGIKTINNETVEVKSRGGWAALNVAVNSKANMVLGGTVDNPENTDLVAGDKIRNLSIFTNTTINLNPSVRFGLELSYWNTSYAGAGEKEAFRVQGALMYLY